MSYAIGIDLGTTNSVVSVFRRQTLETVAIDGSKTVPSALSYRNDGQLLVGKSAKSRLILDPDNSIASSKRFMGDRTKRFAAGGKEHTPTEVGSIILKYLVDGASKTLGQAIHDVVITVPAYFTEAQKEETKKAGENIGLNVLRLLPEPTAAAIAYGLDKGRDQTIMVYDLGGGTFDVSILEVKDNQFIVKAVGGDSQLGGDDLDHKIVEWAAQQFKQQTGIDILGTNTRQGKQAQQRLKEVAERAKIELSESSNAMLEIPDCLGQPLEIEITLSVYNQLIEPLLNQTVACMRFVLDEAKLEAEDIDRVILVGGSTRNRASKKLSPKKSENPILRQMLMRW
jgi:molecular chaperone DnaK